MRKVILLISAALLFISGCLETELEIFLNTDGSGKMIMDTELSPMVAMQYSMFSEEATDSNAMVRQMLQNQMFRDNDTLVWEAIDSGTTSEGGLFFNATAYFNDMVDIYGCGHDMPFGGMVNLEITRTDDGKMILTEVDYIMEQEDANDVEKKKTELTDEQLEFKLKQLKMYLQQSKMMMGQYMGDFSYKMTIHLPGVIEDVNVFTVVDDYTVMFEIQGSKIMQEYDKLLADEAKLREMVKSNIEEMPMMEPDEKYMRKVMLGTDDPMRVVIVPYDSMNVDYTKDIETAKENFKQIVEKFGIEYIEPVEVQIDPNDVPEIVNTEVIGAQLVHKSAVKDNEPGLRNRWTSDYEKPRYEMYMFVDFSCPVTEIENIQINSVLDNKGKELVKKDSYAYPEYFSADKTRAKFDVSLEPPSEEANSIKNIKGVITCISSSKLEKADLGFIELKQDAASTDGDVKITYMYKYEDFDPNEECGRAGVAHFEIANHGYKINNINLLDVNGVELKAYIPCGDKISSFGNKTEIPMEFGELIPEKAKIQAERTRHFADFELPFVVKNVTLLGKAIEE